MGFRIISVDHKHYLFLTQSHPLNPILSQRRYHCQRKSLGRHLLMFVIREAGWYRFGGSFLPNECQANTAFSMAPALSCLVWQGARPAGADETDSWCLGLCESCWMDNQPERATGSRWPALPSLAGLWEPSGEKEIGPPPGEKGVGNKITNPHILQCVVSREEPSKACLRCWWKSKPKHHSS